MNSVTIFLFVGMTMQNYIKHEIWVSHWRKKMSQIRKNRFFSVLGTTVFPCNCKLFKDSFPLRCCDTPMESSWTFRGKGCWSGCGCKSTHFFLEKLFQMLHFLFFFVSKSHLCAMRTKSCAFHSPHAYHHRTGCGTGILSLAHHRTDVRHHRIYI